MTTDNKTLADVQPGGRVRLGDDAERARFEAWADQDGYGLQLLPSGDYYNTTTICAWFGWQAALSAQPSPGGQGEGLAMAAGKLLDVVRELCLNDDPHPPKSLSDAAENLQSVLACRSPLGPCNCCGGTGYVDDGEINCYPDGTPYECGPVKCIKDCPSCAAHQPVGDQHPDDLAVDAFAAAMKAKMAEARAKGRGGWEDPAQCTAEDLSRMLRNHVEKGDPRDVANFCMMLHQRGEAIAARQPVGEPFGYCADFDPGAHEFSHTFYYLAPGEKVPAGCTPFFAAPPAQAVDLGQFRALAEFGEEFACSAEKQPQSRVIYAQARRLLALIDSHSEVSRG
ncbi:hypothetical protein [Stenotrophomonas maltophilia]|uniref:hypothetical protein n=2 Tax=Stenotrophomonas maltophilia TaxID=40324 RepID=UPI0039C0E58C